MHLVLGQDVALLLSLCMAKWLCKWWRGWLNVRSNTKNAKSLIYGLAALRNLRRCWCQNNPEAITGIQDYQNGAWNHWHQGTGEWRPMLLVAKWVLSTYQYFFFKITGLAFKQTVHKFLRNAPSTKPTPLFIWRRYKGWRTDHMICLFFCPFPHVSKSFQIFLSCI